MTSPGVHPLDDLADRLRALHPTLPHLYAIERRSPDLGPDWFPIASALPAMFARPGPHLAISPAVAAARLTISLAHAALGRPTVGLAFGRRVPDLDSLIVRLGEGGLIEQAAVTGSQVALLADDPLSAHSDSVVIDYDELLHRTARRAFAILDPLIDELHERTRFGVVPMWNLTADSALGPSTVMPLLAGFDQDSGRAAAAAVVDVLVDLGAPIRRRGSTQPVSTRRGAALAPVRGSCCLLYRDAGGRGRPTSESLCASCPLLDPAHRALRLEATLPREMIWPTNGEPPKSKDAQ